MVYVGEATLLEARESRMELIRSSLGSSRARANEANSSGTARVKRESGHGWRITHGCTNAACQQRAMGNRKGK